MKPSLRNSKRVVVKVGSSLLYADKKNGARADITAIKRIAVQIAELTAEGNEIIIVSSGAIGLGMSLLGLKTRPKEISLLQASAAVGQNELMNIYRQVFSVRGLICAQVLLTWEDFISRNRYLNAKNTLLKLLKLGSIPVVNENDTVATDEIKFGDNDRLSALVAGLVSADLLINLSDVDGLLDKDRKKVIRLVEKITPQIRAIAAPSDNKSSVGGMITKLDSARIATESGIPYVIANGRARNTVKLLAGKIDALGTLFAPRKGYLAEKKRWIAFSSRPQGRIIIDDGAKKALLSRKSLLCVGIVSSEGDFQPGDIVSISDAKNNDFARGKAELSSDFISRLKGQHFEKEAVHCNNIVIL